MKMIRSTRQTSTRGVTLISLRTAVFSETFISPPPGWNVVERRLWGIRTGCGESGSLVVVRAGEIEAAAGFGAEKLAPALLEPPAAVRAGAHDLLGAGLHRRRVAARVGSRIGVLAQDRISVGLEGQGVKQGARRLGYHGPMKAQIIESNP